MGFRYHDLIDIGEMEEGRKGSTTGEEEQEEEQEFPRKDSERNFLLPPQKRSVASRERSMNGHSEDRRSR